MGPGRPEHVLLKLKKLNGGSELFEPQQLFNPRLAFNLKYRDAFAEEDLRDIFADDNSFSASMLRPGHFIEVPVRIGLTWISLPEPPLSGTELKPLPVTASPGRGTPNHAKLQDMLERKQQQQHQRENVQTIEFSRTADWVQAIKERNPSRPERASKRDTLFVKVTEREAPLFFILAPNPALPAPARLPAPAGGSTVGAEPSPLDGLFWMAAHAPLRCRWKEVDGAKLGCLGGSSVADHAHAQPVASPRLASYLREHYAPGKVYEFLPHADDKSPLPCFDEFHASPTIEFKGKPNDKQYYIPVEGTSKGVTYFAGTKYFAPVALDDPEHGVLWKDGTLRLWPVGKPWQDGELVERRGVELRDLSQALQLKLDCDLHDGHRGLQFTVDEMKVIFLSCLDGSSLKNNCYYVKLGETALGTARYFQLHSMSAGHTTWLSLGSSEPHLDQHLDQHSAKGAGKAAVALEIMNPEFAKLVSARVQSKSYPKVDFSQSEFDAFGMTRLPHDSFIVSEGSYWRPADIAVKYFRPAGEDEMHLVDPFFKEYADATDGRWSVAFDCL
jgi:hypothetical protein